MRSVRLVLRSTGFVTALSGGDATGAYRDFDRETDLARVVTFDYTMRFDYGENAIEGHDVDPSE